MRIQKQLFLIILICVSIASIIAQEIPVTILNALRDKPEDRFIGIGMAKAESEWESVSLAMTRARVQIARAVSSEVRSEISDYREEDDSSDIAVSAFQIEIDEVLSTAQLYGTRIVVLTKTPDGAWWCAIDMPKSPVTVTPQQINFYDIFLYDLSRVSSINNPRVVSDIDLWINHLFQRQFEDMVYGIGVARLGTDTASFLLAKERAVNSIANALHAEITSTVNYQSFSSEIDPDDFTEQFYESVSDKSDYENTDLPLGLVDFVKTEDGSLWVALGCKVISETVAARLAVPWALAFDAETRMEEALRRAAEEDWF